MISLRKAGFTLVEVLAAIAISSFLLAALYFSMDAQEQFTAQAEASMRRTQIARSLLERLGHEIRSVTAPVVGDQDPTRARKLLALGNLDLRKQQEQPTPENQEGEELAIPENPERFSILGTSNRLLMLVHETSPGESSIERYKREQSDAATGSPNDADDERRRADRWGDIRQVFYLMKPRSEFLKTPDSTAVEDPSTEIDASQEEEFEPYFAGVIRQEVRCYFNLTAHEDAFVQLAEQVMPAESALEPDVIEPETPILEEGPEEIPLPDRTITQLLSDEITALRFRYHDGGSWQTGWWDHARLPRAIEISLSFDERASDPTWLDEKLLTLPEPTPPLSSDPDKPIPPTTEVEDGEDEPIFPYRLVVALPCAERSMAPPIDEPLSPNAPVDEPPFQEEPLP